MSIHDLPLEPKVLRSQVWLFIAYIVPQPRKPLPSEQKYRTLDENGKLTSPQDLPSWMDSAKEKWAESKEKNESFDPHKYVEAPEVFITLVIPAYNEEKRLLGMLEEKQINKGIIVFPGNMTPSARKVSCTTRLFASHYLAASLTGYSRYGSSIPSRRVFRS